MKVFHVNTYTKLSTVQRSGKRTAVADGKKTGVIFHKGSAAAGHTHTGIREIPMQQA